MEAIITALEAIRPQGDFCTRISVPTDDLQIRVGEGPPLAWPMTNEVARALIGRARPAKFGWRDQTLQDDSIRNTWEIPKSRVKIDKRRWNKTLHPLLNDIKTGLGLEEGVSLTASLHNMLIYQPGQFFQPHQDSEKEEGMVATLVIALPCTHTGGSLVIDHAGTRKRVHTSRAAKDKLTCIAFYADCHHEVKPVTSGFRAVLTYNLLVKGATQPVPTALSGDAVTAPLARALDDYFAQCADKPKVDTTYGRRQPSPPKWVYLLDHQYTEKSLSWNQLKNGDRLKADALIRVAADLGLEHYIALADIHESWQCEDDYDDYRYQSRRRRYRHGVRNYDDEPVDTEDRYTLIDLIESDVSLRHWVGESGESVDYSGLPIGDDELCWTKASDEFDPFSSDYEGWMGNYGNTLDRWYHRAAVVLWRREDRHAMLCAIDPRQLVKDLDKLARKAATRAEALTIVAGVLPYWAGAFPRYDKVDNRWLKSVLGLALRLESPASAQDLVAPCGLLALNTVTAKAFSALERQYGAPWCVEVLTRWSEQRSSYRQHEPVEALGPLIAALRRWGMSGVDSQGGEAGDRGVVIAWLCQYQFDNLRARDAEQLRLGSPARLASQGDARMERAGELLEACATAGSVALQGLVLAYLIESDRLYDPIALGLLCLRLLPLSGEAAEGSAGAGAYLALRQHALDRLNQELAAPVRDANDWAIVQTTSCHCADCQVLNRYLTGSAEREKVWPLAKPRRQHIHQQLESLGVPVTHQTRREGSPHRLVLTKTAQLHQREAERRELARQTLGQLSTPIGPLR